MRSHLITTTDRVQTPHQKGWRLVVDRDGLVPDLVNLHSSLSDWFWVRARCVYDSDRKILRPLQYAEILGLWDYEGKLEATNWTGEMQEDILNFRLSSPPAKMLRALTFKVCSLLAPSAPTLDSSAGLRQGGLTSAVPFGDLEREVDVKLTVATADDDMADLEQWLQLI